MEEQVRETTRRRLQYEHCNRLHILEWRSFSLLESVIHSDHRKPVTTHTHRERDKNTVLLVWWKVFTYLKNSRDSEAPGHIGSSHSHSAVWMTQILVFPLWTLFSWIHLDFWLARLLFFFFHKKHLHKYVPQLVLCMCCCRRAVFWFKVPSCKRTGLYRSIQTQLWVVIVRFPLLDVV